MKLSFVIPAHNEEAYVGKCLDSIFKQLRGAAYDAEIIVVDNASTDRTKEVARKYPRVKVIGEPRKGIVWARRAGFLASSGDLVANVDADTMLTPGWIKRVFEEFSKDPHLLALSGPFIYYDLPPKTRILVKIFYHLGYLTYLVNHFILRASSMLQGGNYVIKRGALEAIGGYNTNIEFYGEDTDIARRVNKIGRVKFTFDLPMYASGRRLKGEGTFTTGLRYAMNYFWIIVFKRPFSASSADIRAKSGALPRPSKIRELAIASITVLILLAILFGAGFGTYKLAKSGVVATITISNIKAEARKLEDKIADFSNRLKKSIKNNLKANESR